MVREIEFIGLSASNFSFSKKGGVVFMRNEDFEKPFTFHWNRQTVLDADNQWAKQVTHHFNKSSKSDFANDWDGIIFASKIWLDAVKAGR